LPINENFSGKFLRHVVYTCAKTRSFIQLSKTRKTHTNFHINFCCLTTHCELKHTIFYSFWSTDFSQNASE